MRGLEEIAAEVLRCALAWDRESRIVGNVRADELAKLAASRLSACPLCGSEPWCDIDCSVCAVMSALEAQDGEPRQRVPAGREGAARKTGLAGKVSDGMRRWWKRRRAAQ